MTYSNDEEKQFEEMVEKQKRLRESNKQLSNSVSVNNAIYSLDFKQQDTNAKLIEEAKSKINPSICCFCGAQQIISDKDYIGFIRYSFPIPDFKCDCNEAIIERNEYEKSIKQEQDKHKLEQYKKDVTSLLPKRFSESSFDNYIGLDKEKKELQELSKNLSGLFLTGNTGTGKTHLATAYLKKCLSFSYKNEINLTFIFTEIPEIISNYYVDNKSFNNYKNCDILVIDDLGSESYKDWGESKIYELINYRYKELKQTIITSNLSLKELSIKIGDRAVSRITEMCKKIEITGEDYRVKKFRK